MEREITYKGLNGVEVYTTTADDMLTLFNKINEADLYFVNILSIKRI